MNEDQEEFTLWQYGAGIVTDGKWRGVACSFGSPGGAMRAANHYYREMNEFDHNDMDMSHVNNFAIRRRSVTFQPWTDEEFNDVDELDF